MTGLGEQIRKARQNNGYTQAQLASKIGVSTNTIARWEHDIHTPTIDDVKKLASVLNVDFGNLKDSNSDATTQMTMQLEDIRLELANSEKSKRRIVHIFIIVVFVLLLLFFAFVMRMERFDPETPEQPVKIVYYDVEEGENQ
ncbi:MAG: helix-turn-helix domain-containing protein [Clostridia bacterium]|nr:helix-turn-helix domain-containing protein [Clostridia bacterium]